MSVLHTITPIIASNLGFQFDDGHWLFRHLDLSLKAGVTGLVGRNGSGKSQLASLIAGLHAPTEGNIAYQLEGEPSSAIARFTQLPSMLLESEQTVAQFLGLDAKLAALHAITQGSTEQHHFNQLGEDWEVALRLQALLQELRLPQEADYPCSKLSGGQLAVLQLHKLFESDAEVLILDEPTNHMDAHARNWLIEQLNLSGVRHPKRAVLLVSHDRALLEKVDGIYYLSALGLSYYAGGYSNFQQRRQLKMQAVERKVERLTKNQKAIERQAQANLEKAQQREAQGNKLRKSGSQSKLILDGMKNKAEVSRSSQLTNQNNQLERNSKALKEAKSQQEQFKKQSLYLQSVEDGKRSCLLSLEQFALTQVEMKPHDLRVIQGQRVQLSGANGSGKSLLLKAIEGQHQHFVGVRVLHSSTVYLDQHFGLLPSDSTLIDALMDFCPGVLKNDAWLLLASIGFRRDAVMKRVSQLSGGEKMKLAMLMVSHRSDAPLLLLDEPDNHLDIESKELLVDALAQYRGAFVVVSHDQHFVEALGVDTTVSL